MAKRPTNGILSCLDKVGVLDDKFELKDPKHNFRFKKRFWSRCVRFLFLSVLIIIILIFSTAFADALLEHQRLK